MTDTAAAPAAPAAAPAAAPVAAPPAPASTAAALAAPEQITAAAAAALGTAPATEGLSWLPGATEDMVGYVKNKGWTDPKQVLEGYQNLEKMRGVPADRLLTLPASDADQAARDAFFDKLGRPKEAAGYEFSIGADGQDGGWNDHLKQTFHKAGLTAEQAKTVISDYAAKVQADAEAQAVAQVTKVQGEHAELMREWGAAANQNLDAARKGKELLKFSDADVDAQGQSIGHKRAMKLLHDVATRSGEAGYVTDTGAQGYGNAMTPAQATARLAELTADKDWVKRLQAGGPDSKEAVERRRLINFQVAGR